MTNRPDLDRMPPKALEGLALPFESNQTEIAGVRLLPAQLARLLGVSRQAVSEWVKAGRVVLGLDGRVDPNKAVADLMRTGDPRRLRAKLLQPLAADLRARDARLAALEERVAALGLELAAANDDADFHEVAAAEYCEIFSAIQAEIGGAWSWLRERPDGADLLLAWLDTALQHGVDGLTIASVAGRDDEASAPTSSGAAADALDGDEWKGAGHDA